ncbi:cation diffusion facilitator family transporter [Altericroceibacterium endophyticum]|uniref:Cation diffusion facilitator family transporter n=1 Tax=Altericroceibacterium endophyticum TaxID=1808508 RepID=A0A6I4T699_9SPHN|nr:cation diffusion facilitator family transporter [Altericroceibacterium endophyticum]MXO66367.1 cation diffusion facilitator family transporter [Altericroceibacterium endophyticum]
MSVFAYIRKNIVLLGAFAANLGIAIAKFVAASITGSSSMLSEGIHSVVDSMNQLLLLYGEHRADRPANRAHPFGYGRELYFWAFVVAILIFGLGAGLSFYEGFKHYIDPEELRDPTVNYIVLGVAMLLEGTSWFIAIREFSARKGKLGWWSAMRRSKDPSLFVVVFEDSAALAGLIVAAIGIWASHYYNAPQLDGAASMVIGVILAMVAVLLAREAKGLLIGEAADVEVVDKIRHIVGEQEWITSVNHVRTLHTSPRKIFAAISADMVDSISIGEAEQLIEELEQELIAQIPELTSIYVRPEKRENAILPPGEVA